MARIYRLPLRLITQGKWRAISHAAQAILPAIGLYADKDDGKAFPGIKIIQKLSGCRTKATVIVGIRSLIKMDLIDKVREGRRNIYFLKPPAILKIRGSYYPMSEEFIKTEWINMSYIEKAVFGVLAVKAAIQNPDWPDIPLTSDLPPWAQRFVEFGDDENVFGHGIIQREKWTRLAGVSRQSWVRAIQGLIDKGKIVVTGKIEYIACG